MMRIIVSAQGESLDAPTSPVFGRCPAYILVDTETAEFQAVPNPALDQGGGAGIQAAQYVVEHGPQAILTGNLGPNAFDVLLAAGIPAYLVPEGTVRQAVDAFKAQQVKPLSRANVATHAAMGSGAGLGGTSAGVWPATSANLTTDPLPDLARAPGTLGDTLKRVRQQLAEAMARIDELERETQKREE